MMVKYTRYPIQIHNVIDVKFTDGRNVISILLYSHYLLIVFIFQLNALNAALILGTRLVLPIITCLIFCNDI